MYSMHTNKHINDAHLSILAAIAATIVAIVHVLTVIGGRAPVANVLDLQQRQCQHTN